MNMPPPRLRFYFRDHLLADAESARYRILRIGSKKDLHRRRIGQFGELLNHASRSGSPLRHSIGHVVGVRSEEQVIRVDAGWVVALVANGHTRRDLSISQSPRQSVGQVSLFADINPTVSRLVHPAQPKSATAHRFWNGVKIQSLRRREATRRTKVSTFSNSHLKLRTADDGQGSGGARNVVQPANYSTIGAGVAT